MKRTRAQRSAARKNGKKGGRPKMTVEQRILERVRAQRVIDDATEAAARFLVDLMDGKVPNTTGSDRRLAAESILDRNLGRAAAQIVKKDSTGDAVAAREVKTVVRTAHKPPEGWKDETHDPPAEA